VLKENEMMPEKYTCDGDDILNGVIFQIKQFLFV